MTEASSAAVSIPAAHLHQDYIDGEQLGDEITELCSYIYAATYRLLVLIHEFDEKGYWQLSGIISCAHWLNFKCGIGMNAAREKVRVANSLVDLPKISEAFRKGKLSYSKARAMTRVANADNEDYLLMIARHGSAWHVEKLVSKYSRAKRLQETDAANAQHASRELNYFYDDDGALVLNGRLPAEQGALVVKALEMAMERQFQQTSGAAGDGTDINEPAGDPENVSAETPERESISARRADAMAEVAETYLNSEPVPASTADRYQVIVHVSAETSHLEDGPHVSAETSRRIACDCTLLTCREDENGELLSIGRRSRSIPNAIRRALRLRDAGCRFPGCTRTRHVDGHHVEHWADGGETSLDNLVQLCRHHHRLVHEGGFACEQSADGEIEFRDPAGHALHKGSPLPGCTPSSESPLPAGRERTQKFSDWMQFEGLATDMNSSIDAQTCVPQWYAGDRMDWDMGVAALFSCSAPDSGLALANEV